MFLLVHHFFLILTVRNKISHSGIFVMLFLSTATKETVFGYCLARIFPDLGWIRERTDQKIPNTETFHAVKFWVHDKLRVSETLQITSCVFQTVNLANNGTEPGTNLNLALFFMIEVMVEGKTYTNLVHIEQFNRFSSIQSIQPEQKFETMHQSLHLSQIIMSCDWWINDGRSW